MDRTRPAPPPRRAAADNDLAGRQPHALDRTLALLARDVYAGDGGTVGGWSAVSAAELARLGVAGSPLHDGRTGFAARLYVHPGHGYILAFRGSDERADWIGNLRQAAGLPAPQYRQAVELATEVSEALGPRLVGMTGHSLGGGLAAVASLRTGVAAVTFNAAGVRDSTLERLGIARDVRDLAAESGHVRRYTVDNDILTELQEHMIRTRTVLPDPIGHRIRLPDPDPLSFLQRGVPVIRLPHALDRHSMDTVISALEPAAARDARTQGAAALVLQSLRGLRDLQDATRLPPLTADGLLSAASCIALRARDSGIARIDLLACSADGARLFAIQGGRDDPAQRRITVDLDTATSEPVHPAAARVAAPEATPRPSMSHDGPQQAHRALGH
jgi:hypothetical protein